MLSIMLNFDADIPDLAFTRFIPIVASWFTSVDLRDANANFGCKQIRRRFLFSCIVQYDKTRVMQALICLPTCLFTSETRTMMR